MKKVTTGVVLVLFLVFVYIVFWGYQRTKMNLNSPVSEYTVRANDMVNGEQLIKGIPKSTLTEAEIKGLLQMREEEKLARDVYTTLSQKWNLPMFANISQSEQTHTNAVKVLLDRYGILDPVTDNAVGVFKSKTFQDLYNDLVAKGNRSQVDSLLVGATVEDLDIFDLGDLMKQTSKQDILVTYSNLQRGSRNHMRAFVRNLIVRGGEYIPQYISKDEFNSIINSSQERGS